MQNAEVAESTPSRSQPLRVGRYEVVGHLAAGGMAEILLGRLVGPSGFERPVVIKRILPHLAREKAFVDMFLDEARIAAGIRHANVVHVTDLSDATGELYLVMEYLEGESLATLLRRTAMRAEALPPVEAAHLVAEACAGLHAAHELMGPDGARTNLVHRDVSPQNVFVGYDGHVKVLDFGIAKAADRLTQTEAGQLKGKVEYMSPEQCEGEALDRRSDVFALGIVLYETSTMRRLFKRDNKLQSMRAVVEGAIPRPSALVPGYPAELETIVMRALSRSREERFATAADMRRELLTFIRRASGDTPTDELLSLRMHALFAARMEEKREMLRRVRAGSALTHVPVAEPDPAVELASVPDGTELATAPIDLAVEPAEPSAASSSARSRVAIASVLGLVCAAGLAWAATRGEAFVSAPPIDPAPAPIVPTVAPSVDVPAATPVETTHVTVDSEPSGASVSIGDDVYGTTPLVLTLPHAPTATRVLRVSMAGYASADETVSLAHDAHVRVTLLRVRRTARPAPVAASPDPAAAPRFRRFD